LLVAELSFCTINLIMRLRCTSTVASNERTAEEVSLDDDAPRECDTTPVIPINLISHLILPFLDRPTWNAVCSANKELHEAGMRMTPPWPATKLRMGLNVATLKFSPCGSFLATGAYSSPYLVHICDRRGRQTCLTGHTQGILFLSFSNDGNYLASAGCSRYDTSIQIWPANSTTRLPQQSDKTLRGHQRVINCLDFSPDDTNILASGEYGTIKLWNVEQEVCIFSFDHFCGSIRSLYFPVEDEGQKCIFVTADGSLVRTWWNDLSEIESDIVDMPGLGSVQTLTFSHCRSLLAAVSLGGGGGAVTIYNMLTLTVVRRLPLPGDMYLAPYNCLTFSPDGKTLVLRFTNYVIQICEVSDLNISRLLQPHSSAHASIGAVAFDPSGQFLSSVGGDDNVRLWTL
jgi:WD40 repeat protein